MTFGSLFAGIGGFDLGLERAGMACKWQVEIDPFCLKVLKKHWPDVPKHADIRKTGGYNLERTDLICGGFPCQPFSVAGKQRGTSDDRYLWPEMLRVIQEIKPAWVVGENVPGLLNIDGGMVFDTVLSDLEAAGYETTTFIIPACAVDAPHRRDRLWIVANRERKGLERHRRSQNTRQAGWKDEGGHTGSSGDGFDGYGYVADTGCQLLGEGNITRMETEKTKRASCDIFNQSGGQGQVRQWPVEPAVGELVNGISDRLVRFRGRTAVGIPNRVNKLKSLGNAVVPQVVEMIGRAIIEAEKNEHSSTG